MGKWSSISDAGKNIMAFEENVNSPHLDTVALGMIINNNIPFIVPCSAAVVDDTQILKFNISGYENMATFISVCTDINIVVSLLSDMCSTVREIGKYMMSVSNLVFDTNKMYVDTANMKVLFLADVEPLEKENVNMQNFFMAAVYSSNLDGNNLKRLRDMIMRDGFRIDRFEDDLIGICTKSYTADISRSNTGGQISDIPSENDVPSVPPIPAPDPNENKKGRGLLDRLLPSRGTEKKNSSGQKGKAGSLMNGVAIPGETGEKNDVGESPVPHPKDQPSGKKQQEIKVNTWKPIAVEAPEFPQRNSEKTKSEPISKPAPEADPPTKFEPEIDGPTAFEQPCGKLVNKKTGDVVNIDKDVFSIGRGTTGANDLILTKETVGRVHAVIMKKGNQYFIMDKNSKNHTYVNDRQLIGNEEVMLKNGYSVRFSSEEFEFRYEN